MEQLKIQQEYIRGLHMQTIVYLSNREIQVILGKEKNNKAAISHVYELQVPEECLINGVITDAALLLEYVSTFWSENKLPKQKVKVVINSTQFVLKTMEVPKMKHKELLDVIKKEFASVDRKMDPIYSYRVMNSMSSSQRLLAVMVERGYIQDYLEFFRHMDVKIDSIEPSLGCAVALLERIPALEDKNCIVQVMEKSNLTSILWMNNGYEYASRNRLFSDSGTESMGSEVGRITSQILQFYASLKKEQPVTEIYACGFSEEDMLHCAPNIQNLNLYVKYLVAEDVVTFAPRIVNNDIGNYMLLLGGLFKDDKNCNVLAQYRKVKKVNVKRLKLVKSLIPIMVALLVCGGAAGLVVAYNNLLQKKADELSAYLLDDDNIEQVIKSEELQLELTILTNRVMQAGNVKEALASYPRLNSKVERAIINAGQTNFSTTIKSYDGNKGGLNLKALLKRPEDINEYISSLQKLDLFRKVEYSGYTYNEFDNVYEVNIICYLNENAGR